MSLDTSQLDPATTEGRRLLQKQQLRALTELRSEILSLDPAVFNDDQLASLAIRKLSPIDVDGSAPFDPDPLFFLPYPMEDGQDFRSMALAPFQGLEHEWLEMCKDGECDGCSCGRWRMRWADDTLGTFGEGLRENTEWGWGTW